MITAMTPLRVTALTMVNKPAAEVHTALLDYEQVRPALLTEEFTDYRVHGGGQGGGTEVGWTLVVDERRPKALYRLFGGHKRPTWACRAQVESEELRVVERDTERPLVTTWTVTPNGDRRCVVQVQLDWEAPGGPRTRLREKLALRRTYESLLSNLHNHFEPGRSRK